MMVSTTWRALTSGRGAIRGPAALTIGTFDGVHLGHREILRQLAAGAAGERGPGSGVTRGSGAPRRVVLTFLQHPRSVLTREHPGALTTLRQRRERFAALGVTHLVLIDFSVQFSRLSGREFVAALRRGMALDTLVVGVDFRCGRGRDTDVAELQRLLAPAGVRVVAVPPVTVGGYAVSSTRIRAAVRAGDFAATEEMMGLPFEVDLRAALETTSPAVSDHEAAFDYGATSRRLYVAAEQMEQILPQPGTYATSVVTAGGGAVAAVAEVAPDGVRCTLPAGLRELPLGLRFHRRADARCGTLPLVEGGAAIASRIQEK